MSPDLARFRQSRELLPAVARSCELSPIVARSRWVWPGLTSMSPGLFGERVAIHSYFFACAPPDEVLGRDAPRAKLRRILESVG